LTSNRHSNFVLGNFDWSGFVKELWTSLIHTKLYYSSVKFVLLGARTSKILSILGSNSKTVLFDLVLHKLSIEKR